MDLAQHFSKPKTWGNWQVTFIVDEVLPWELDQEYPQIWNHAVVMREFRNVGEMVWY